MRIDPIIIFGMHRSGTTMLAKSLAELGLFTGEKKEENYESKFFLKINSQILTVVNASWDNPNSCAFIENDVKHNLVKELKKNLKSIHRISYLGVKYFFQYRDLRDLDFLWGWKDPRNTYTTNIWREIFPNSKIIHIYRNPVDVAKSLKFREIQRDKRIIKKIEYKIKELLSLHVVAHQSPKLKDIHEGIKLWEQYITQAFLYDKNIIHVRYESFLENPNKYLRDILDFINLKPTDSKIYKTIKTINLDRKFAFTNNKELIRLYYDIKDRKIMKKLNYHNILI